MKTKTGYWHKRLFCECGWNKLVNTHDLKIALCGMAVCPQCGVDTMRGFAAREDKFRLRTVRKLYRGNAVTHFLSECMMWTLKWNFEFKSPEKE